MACVLTLSDPLPFCVALSGSCRPNRCSPLWRLYSFFPFFRTLYLVFSALFDSFTAALLTCKLEFPATERCARLSHPNNMTSGATPVLCSVMLCASTAFSMVSSESSPVAIATVVSISQPCHFAVGVHGLRIPFNSPLLAKLKPLRAVERRAVVRSYYGGIFQKAEHRGQCLTCFLHCCQRYRFGH